jgi:hypothetical protein
MGVSLCLREGEHDMRESPNHCSEAVAGIAVGRAADACCPGPAHRDRSPFANAEGVRSFSPGLRGTRYPGSVVGPGVYPGRVVALRGDLWPRPFQGGPGSERFTQRSSRARNAGLRDAIPSGLEIGGKSHPVGGSTGSEVQSALDVTGPVCVSQSHCGIGFATLMDDGSIVSSDGPRQFSAQSEEERVRRFMLNDDPSLWRPLG